VGTTVGVSCESNPANRLDGARPADAGLDIATYDFLFRVLTMYTQNYNYTF
jgi:hypothetical protein